MRICSLILGVKGFEKIVINHPIKVGSVFTGRLVSVYYLSGGWGGRGDGEGYWVSAGRG